MQWAFTMYRVLVVDDEEVVREGIAHNIDWEAHGFELVGTCGNGRDAADAMVALRPDLVITDICMPFLDGLDLTELIAGRFPTTKVILLTGFNEFAYAQRAVKLNAYDFILKPITARELRELLGRARANLDAERTRMDEIERMRLRLGESLSLLRERLVGKLLAGTLGPTQIDREREESGLPAAGFWTPIALELDIPHPIAADAPALHHLEEATPVETGEPAVGEKASVDFKRLALTTLCRELVERTAAEGGEGAVAAAPDLAGRVLLLVPGASAEAAHRAALAAAATARAMVVEQLRCTCSAGVGSATSELKELPLSYRDALLALDRRFFMGADRVFTAGDLPSPSVREAAIDAAGAGLAVDSREAEQRLLQTVRTGTAADCIAAVDALAARLRSGFATSRRAYLALQRLLTRIAESCEELRIDADALLASDEADPFAEILSLPTLDEIAARMKGLCLRIIELLGRKRQTYTQVKSQQAEEHIAQHYRDPRFSLQSLCSDLGVSPSHFSMIFKEATGRTFTEYLTEVRLEQAMILLRTTDMKAYEIARAVGYADQHYFSIIFKKETGLSPIQYREKVVAASR